MVTRGPRELGRPCRLHRKAGWRPGSPTPGRSAAPCPGPTGTNQGCNDGIAKRSGYRRRSGDASIGGEGETVEVSQPRLWEVIPMRRRACSATSVQVVKWEEIDRGRRV